MEPSCGNPGTGRCEVGTRGNQFCLVTPCFGRFPPGIFGIQLRPAEPQGLRSPSASGSANRPPCQAPATTGMSSRQTRGDFLRRRALPVGRKIGPARYIPTQASRRLAATQPQNPSCMLDIFSPAGGARRRQDVLERCGPVTPPAADLASSAGGVTAAGQGCT